MGAHIEAIKRDYSQVSFDIQPALLVRTSNVLWSVINNVLRNNKGNKRALLAFATLLRLPRALEFAPLTLPCSFVSPGAVGNGQIRSRVQDNSSLYETEPCFIIPLRKCLRCF